ncbi:MAG: gliding motility-associated C-terminal domain-containing protein [Cyclobacteriaceae bacterium]
MRTLFIHITLLLPLLSYAQFHTGDSTKLAISSGATFFMGGNTTLNGPLTNFGKIVSYRDLDFVGNTDVGNLKFTGDIDQSLSGDTIDVGSFELDKAGRLILLTGQVRATGGLTVTRGVIQSDDELDFIQAGSVDATGTGYVEGKMIGRLNNAATFTFPMGLTDANGNGYKNYLTLTANKPGTFVRVECKRGNPNLLFPDSLMDGLADEVEWVVHVLGQDSVEATIALDYSGVDLSENQFPNLINADIHEPAIAMFYREDTLHHALRTATSTTATDNTTGRDGYIESNQSVWITNAGRRFSIALVPLADGDVFYVPNVFAPNALMQDNRIFRPFFVGSSINRISIEIFDSFNQIVYSVNETGSGLDVTQYGWDGFLLSSQEAPGGVYYYKITLETNSNEYTKSGPVLLMR